MSVSSGGVSARGPKGPNPWDIAAIASDPKKFSKHMAEITAATAENIQSVELVGKASQITALLAQTKEDRAKARSTVQGANTRAKGILVKAEEKAAELLSAAKEDNDSLKAANRRAREAVKEREDTFKAL